MTFWNSGSFDIFYFELKLGAVATSKKILIQQNIFKRFSAVNIRYLQARECKNARMQDMSWYSATKMNLFEG